MKRILRNEQVCGMIQRIKVVVILLLGAKPLFGQERELQQERKDVSACVDVSTKPICLPSVNYVLAEDVDVKRTLCYAAKEVTLYECPYSKTLRKPDWKRLWVNTASVSSAFVGTLLVLECLPEDATTWNRAELQDVPLHERWWDHVVKKGPEVDHDKFYWNYIMHPYAGAAYFMGARSCGFNFWQSLLYCTCVSNIGWEYGIEAFMERPSIQDLFITPIVGSVIGECFYKVKRGIVKNGYTLGGSAVLGNVVAFLIDPVNEVVGLFAGNPCRAYAKAKRKAEVNASIVVPTQRSVALGLSVNVCF